MRSRGLPITIWARCLWIMLCLLVSMALSCADERVCGCSTDLHPKPTRTTPDGLIDAFLQAYAAKDANTYSDLLLGQYNFCFVKAGYDTPEAVNDTCLDRTVDISSTKSMFEDPRVGAIDIDFTKVLPWDACLVESVPGLCCMVRPDIKVTIKEASGLTVAAVPQSNPTTWGELKLSFAESGKGLEPGTIWIHRSWVTVTVARDPLHPGLWAIMSLKESPGPQ